MIRDAYAVRRRRLARTDGRKNKSDGLTKGMKDHQAFLEHRTSYGVIDITDLLRDVRPEPDLPARPGIKEGMKRMAGAAIGVVPALAGAVLADDGFRKEVVKRAVEMVFKK